MAKSKKQVEAISSGMGVFVTIISALVELVKDFGGSMEDLYQLGTPEGRQKLEAMARIVVDVAKEIRNDFLKLISGSEVLAIDACDGSEGLSNANDVFAWIDPDFEKYGADATGKASSRTEVVVYEMVKDASFVDMFTSLDKNMRKLLLTPHQIKKFVVNHREWLRTDGYGTFFLFESNNEIFVARVGFSSGDSHRVSVYRFENSSVWFAEFRHRLVTPQVA